jgi:hypothetical protein
VALRGYRVILPPEIVIEEIAPPFPPTHVEMALMDAGAMTIFAVALVVVNDPLTVPALSEYPVEDWAAPVKVTLEGEIEGHLIVKEAPSLEVLAKVLQALLLSFVGFSLTLMALAGPPEGLVLQLPRLLLLADSVSLVDVAAPGTRGGLKVTVPVKLVQVMVPVEAFAEATGPLTVSRTIGTVKRTATVRDVRRKRISFPPRVSDYFESER